MNFRQAHAPQSENLEFRNLLERLAELVAHENIPVVAYRSKDHPGFQNLDAENRSRILASLKLTIEAYEELLSSGQSLSRNLNAVWSSLKRRGLVPQSDLFHHLDGNDIIEVYDQSGYQIFRSLHFLELCSYDLETLFTSTFRELFERDSIFDEAQKLLLANFNEDTIQQAAKLQGVEHTVRERSSPARLEFITRTTGAYPLYSKETGLLAGFIHAVQGRFKEHTA